MVAATTVVFWIAHLFADVLGARESGTHPSNGKMLLRQAASESSGLLWAGLLPIFLLALGATGAVDELLAYTFALTGGIVVLFAVGALSAMQRRFPWYLTLLSGVSTALLGSLVAALKILVH